MKTVVDTIHGSKLYGTNYEKSDIDRKKVFAMSLQELITGHDNCFRESVPNDTEFFSLKGKNVGKNNPRYGIPHTEEVKIKLKLIWAKRKEQKNKN